MAIIGIVGLATFFYLVSPKRRKPLVIPRRENKLNYKLHMDLHKILKP